MGASRTKYNICHVVERLSGMTPDEVIHAVTALCVMLAGKLVKVLLVWFVGRWIIGKVVKLLKKIMEKRKVNASVNSFVSSMIDVVAMIIMIIMIISILGIDTSSFIALFASAGVLLVGAQKGGQFAAELRRHVVDECLRQIHAVVPPSS